MSMKMSIDAYNKLITGNIKWLNEQLDTCERSHIEAIVLDSVNYYYPNKKDKRIKELKLANEARQAKIDSLMLEYCPNEMTKDQIENWEKHQVKSEVYNGEV